MTQQFTAQHSAPSLRIGDDAAEHPASRRKTVALCVLAAVGVHAALAIAPLKFGGSAVEYGIAQGDQIQVTLVFDADTTAPAPEQFASVEPPPPAIVSEPAADMQPEAFDEAAAEVAEAAPPVQPVQRQRAATASASVAPRIAARPAGAGQRTVAKPNYLRNPPPKYPAESRKLREEGVVLLKVAVTPEGRAADVQLQRSSGFARLDEAALKAVRRWEFNPARVGATAVAAAVEVPVRFGLN